MKSFRLALLACCLTGGLVSVAWAQRDEGRRDEGGRRGSFDLKEILKRMDRNGNGTIEPDELSDRSRDFVGRLAKQANLDPAQPLAVDKLISAAESGSSGSSSSSGSNSGSSSSSDSRDRDSRDRSDRDRNSSGSSSAKPTPNAMAFGVEDKTPKAVGFDVPLSVDSTIPLEKRYDQRVIEYVDRMLKDYDKNQDGYIDSVEWKEGRWSTPPEESDTNKDNRLSKAELCERIARRFGLQNSPPGSSTASSGSGSSGSSSDKSSDAAKIRTWAEGMVRQHDKNKNGVLDRDEWSELRAEHREADADKDGKITVDELVLKLQAYTTSSSTASNSSSSSNKSGSGSDKKWGWGSRSSSSSTKPSERKDYKLLSAIDRLPKGLPDWFLRNDADADGQIAMVEYAVTWTDATAAEFQKYDLDGDGFITPAEVLAATQTVKK